MVEAGKTEEYYYNGKFTEAEFYGAKASNLYLAIICLTTTCNLTSFIATCLVLILVRKVSAEERDNSEKAQTQF